MLSKRFQEWRIFENAGFSLTCRRTKTEVFESDDVIYRILHVLASHILFNGCYHISIDLAFLLERAKTIQIRYMWTRTFLKMEMEKRYLFPRISADRSEQSYN